MATVSAFLSRLSLLNNAALLVALMAILQTTSLTWACSDVGQKAPDREYKVKWSDTVVHGKVIDVMDPAPGQVGYSVNFKVFCSYKGEPAPRNIRIDRVGPIPGLCYHAELENGKNYLLYLNKEGGRANAYTPTFSQGNSSDTILQEIVFICGIKPQLPQGVEKASPGEECPEANEDPNDCFELPTENIPPMFSTELPPPPPNKDLMSPPPPTKKQPSPHSAENQTPPKPSDKNAPYEAVQENNKQEDPEDSAVSLTWSLLVFLPVAVLHLIR